MGEEAELEEWREEEAREDRAEELKTHKHLHRTIRDPVNCIYCAALDGWFKEGR